MSLVIPPLHGLSIGGSGVPTLPPPGPTPAFFVGMNLSGAENQYPTWPSAANIGYWVAKGVTHFRLPVYWDSIQPANSGPLGTATGFNGPTAGNVTYLACISQVLAIADGLGANVLIDVHASGRKAGQIVGSGSGAPSVADFVDLWSKLSAYLRADPHYAAVVGYDLMNEWHDMDPAYSPGVVDSNAYTRNLIASCNQGVITALRNAGDTKTIHVEGDHYSGAWDWVANNGAWALALDDPLNNLIFHVHCYLDRDSSGTHFAYADEAASPGYAPPGFSTNANIGPQRMAAVTGWAETNGKRLCLGETGWGNDVPQKYNNPRGLDDNASWNATGRGMLQHCHDHAIEAYVWGGGAGFPISYGYCPEPLDLSSGGKDYTATGFQATQVEVIQEFTGVTAQPTSYRIELPFVAKNGDGNTTLYALPLGQPMGGNGGDSSARYFAFRAKYNGKITSAKTITPVAFLADGVTPAPGVTFTPATVTLQPGINPIASFTMTATQAQTMLVGATNNAGWTDPPLTAVSSIADLYYNLGDIGVPIFSTRREYSPYVGPAMRLARASDGAQRDFFFDNVGNLPRQAIQDWASARNNITIVIWFDQSNNGRHAFGSAGRGFPSLRLDNGGYPEVRFENGAYAGMNFSFDVRGAPAISFMARVYYASGDKFLRQDYYGGPFDFNLSNFTITDPRSGATGFNQTISQGIGGGYHSYAATFKANAALGQKIFTDGVAQAQADTLGAYTELHTNLDVGNDTDVQWGWFKFYGGSTIFCTVQSLRLWYAERTAAEQAAFIAADNAYYSTPLPDALSVVKPSIVGATPSRVYPASGQGQPLAGIVINDENSGSPTDSVSIALTGAAATLAGAGLTGAGPYALAADTAANITAKLRALTLSTSAGVGSAITLTLTVTSSTGTTATNATSIVTVAAYGIEASLPAPGGTFAPYGFKGVNLAGGENTPYTAYPKTWQIEYFAQKGFGLIRLPVDCRTMLSNGGFSALSGHDVALIRVLIEYAHRRNMYVAIDLHNYGYMTIDSAGNAGLVGVTPNAADAMADIWSRFASTFKNYPNVIFGLMNEPHDQTAQQWHDGCLPSIGAIRATGATQLILIPGTGYTGAHWWTSQGNAAAWGNFNQSGHAPNDYDPANNFAFEMHQYLDSDDSGTHSAAVGGKGSYVLDQGGGQATSWCRSKGFKAFLGEFGFAPDSWKPQGGNDMGYDGSQAAVATNGQVEGAALMQYMLSNADVWMGWSYWAGGDFYSPPHNGGYAFTPEPERGNLDYNRPIVDQPQMATILANRGYSHTVPIPAVIYRIAVTALGSTNDGLIALTEAEFHTSAGGAQVASASNCFVTSTDFFDVYVPQNLVDGSTAANGSAFISGWNGSGTFNIDFAFATDPGAVEMKLWPQSDHPESYAIDRNPRNFTVQRSTDNGATWTTRATRTAQTWGTNAAPVPTTFAI